MDMNRIEGTLREGAGKAEQVFGKTTDKADVQARGIVDEATGTVQDFYGRMRDAADQAPDTIAEAMEAGQQSLSKGVETIGKRVASQPMESLLLAGAIGYLAAWMLHRRH